MFRARDARQRDGFLPSAPRRILSLVPSDTLSLLLLGAQDRLVGRTDYCFEPAHLVSSIPTIGGPKNPNLDTILRLAPDLVLANQEENSRPEVLRMIEAGLTVYVSFPRRVADGLAHLAVLARLMGVEKDPVARDLVRRGYHALREAEEARGKVAPFRVFYPIWMDPLMTIHGDTFLSDMLDLLGATNVFADRPRRYPLAADLGKALPASPEKVAGRDTRYPRITLDELIARDPDVILLPDEPHPFSEEDAAAFRALPIRAARQGLIVPCSGQDLSWYGAQSVEGLPRMKKFMDALRARVAASNPPPS
jgi:ABC-type Fe3+-hydroxamate transport system substrate-binding protein